MCILHMFHYVRELNTKIRVSPPIQHHNHGEEKSSCRQDALFSSMPKMHAAVIIQSIYLLTPQINARDSHNFICATL